MPPDSPSGSRLRRSKLAWSCSEVWLRPRETNQGEFCRERFAGSLALIMSAWPPEDLSPVRIAPRLILSCRRRNTRAETLWMTFYSALLLMDERSYSNRWKVRWQIYCLIFALRGGGKEREGGQGGGGEGETVMKLLRPLPPHSLVLHP